MKGGYTRGTEQAGVALVVALLFLLVVTVLSVTAARNSSFSLQMSGNMQDALSSFQAAEAGLNAVSLDPNNPGHKAFNRNVDPDDDPFAGLSKNPLSGLADPNSVSAKITRPPPDEPVPCRNESSTGVYACYHYRIDAENLAEMRARTRVSLGVVITELAEK